MNLKDSNIYRKKAFRLTYDSKGVEREYEHCNFYKYAIPLGLTSQKYYKLLIISY